MLEFRRSARSPHACFARNRHCPRTRRRPGNVSAVADSAAAPRNASYTYTDANRLATAAGLWGADAYTWDANGNRTRADRTQGASTASDVATIPAASNRQSEVRDGAGVLAKSFAYRAGGDVVSQTVGATTTGFTYDARGRMVGVTVPRA